MKFDNPSKTTRYKTGAYNNQLVGMFDNHSKSTRYKTSIGSNSCSSYLITSQKVQGIKENSYVVISLINTQKIQVIKQNMKNINTILEKSEEKQINGRPDFNAREMLSEFRNRHDEEAIDNAIYEAEKEFAETGEYIEAKEAFDILDKEFDFDSMNARPNPYAKILKEQNLANNS